MKLLGLNSTAPYDIYAYIPMHECVHKHIIYVFHLYKCMCVCLRAHKYMRASIYKQHKHMDVLNFNLYI